MDGFHALNVGSLWQGTHCIAPCTPKGIIQLIKSTGIEIRGKMAVVVGRSNIVGKPVAKLLLDENGVSHRIGCPSGKIVNSVGAGDSMVAGFLAGYLKSGGDHEYALRLGTAAGSATAFSLRLGSRELIEELLAAL